MPILETIQSVATAVAKIFGFAQDALPPKEIVIDKYKDIIKPRAEQKRIIQIYDREFRRLKDHWEIDIAKDVNLVDDNLPDDQTAELIDLLIARIDRYRRATIRRWKFKQWINSEDEKKKFLKND